MANLRKQVKAYIKETYEQNGTSATTIEYSLDDKPDMLCIYRVASYGIHEGYPYEIRCDKKTGYTVSESKDSDWWTDGFTIITLDEVKENLNGYIDLVEKKYGEILASVEKWFNNLKAN